MQKYANYAMGTFVPEVPNLKFISCFQFLIGHDVLTYAAPMFREHIEHLSWHRRLLGFMKPRREEDYVWNSTHFLR